MLNEAYSAVQIIQRIGLLIIQGRVGGHKAHGCRMQPQRVSDGRCGILQRIGSVRHHDSVIRFFDGVCNTVAKYPNVRSRIIFAQFGIRLRYVIRKRHAIFFFVRAEKLIGFRLIGGDHISLERATDGAARKYK